jgi:hypothetical protein
LEEILIDLQRRFSRMRCRASNVALLRAAGGG